MQLIAHLIGFAAFYIGVSLLGFMTISVAYLVASSAAGATVDWFRRSDMGKHKRNQPAPADWPLPLDRARN
jgi:hypothetical protein